MEEMKVTRAVDEAVVADAAVELENEQTLKELADSLRAEIAAFEQQEKVLAEKLCIAKRRGLLEPAARCRDLLQRLIREKMMKKEQLEGVEESYREAKAKRELAELTAEVDALTEQIETEFFPPEVDLLEKPTFEPAYDHMAKSKRLGVIARAVAAIGVFTALIGSLIFMLFSEMSLVNFSWGGIILFAVIAIAAVVAGLIIGKGSNKHKAIAEQLKLEIEAKMAEYEAEVLARERAKAEMNAPWRLENLDAATEAYALEREKDLALAKAEAIEKDKNRMIAYGSDILGLAKRNAKKLIPVALAGSAVIAAVAISRSKKKKAQAARSAAVRKEFRDWLGG